MSNPTGNRVKIASESSKHGSTLKKGRLRSLKASEMEDYGEEDYSESSPGKSMGPSYYSENASEIQRSIIEQTRVNEGLENRLDQIKNNIKNQRSETLSFGQRGAAAVQRNTAGSNSIQDLEAQLTY